MTTQIIKRMIAWFLAVVMTVSVLPLSALAAAINAIDSVSATEEELLKHRSELFDMADAAGFGVEFELFYSVLDEMEEKGEFWNYDDFAAYCSAVSDEVLLKLLGYLRKFVTAGQVAGYSDVSATEEFFRYEMQNIYYTYLVPGGNGNRVTAQDLVQFENAAMFTKQLPASFYFANPEDVPNELALSVEMSPAVMAEGHEAVRLYLSQTLHSCR